MERRPHLVIVESPAKAKTIEGYLAQRSGDTLWMVRATKGHVCDLPRDTMGIEQQHGRFAAQWHVRSGGQATIRAIAEIAAKAEKVYVATDPDREGEKIGSDIVAYAKIPHFHRIHFTEITPRAINAAIDHPDDHVNEERVDAQIARRLVDRQIGYPASDIIYWAFREAGAKEMPRGIGRVISPALRLLCASEEKIEGFLPETYWRIAADYTVGKTQFRLLHDQKFMAGDSELRDEIMASISTGKHYVANYKAITKDKAPFPPLTTARMQRLAFYLLHMNPEQTMRVAQELYEGVELKNGRHGLITYPRTDSVTLSDDSVVKIIEALREVVDDELILPQKREYKNRETAQAAHEAIRPARFEREFWPSEVAPHVSKDAYELYNLIWMRTLQTQLRDSVYDVSLVEVDCNGHLLKARANSRIFAGWEELDGARIIAAEENEDEPYLRQEVKIPRMRITDQLGTVEVRIIELDTARPPRYGVGRFLTTLDSHGIARPSTLDTVVPSLKKKRYIDVQHGIIYPTTLGRLVDDWTVDNIPWLSDPDHARHFEDALDSVERGESDRDLLIGDYVKRIQAVQAHLGYTPREHDKPTADAISYAERLAGDNGIELPNDVRDSASALTRFIGAHRAERDVLGKCPKCSSRTVTVYDKLFGCASQGCDFKLWINDVQRFATNFHVRIEPKDLVRMLLTRKRVLFEDLTKKDGSKFPAYLAIRQRTEGRTGWEIKIDGFPKKQRKASETEY